MKKVLVCSLFQAREGETAYIRGLLCQKEMIEELYSDWIVRIYVGDTVDSQVVDVMQKWGWEIIIMPHNQYEGLYWRYLPFWDKSIDIWAVFDADTPLGYTRKKIEDIWLKSDKDFLSVFYDTGDGERINGGYFAVKRSANEKVQNAITIEEFKSYYKQAPYFSWDEIWLKEKILPIIKDSVFSWIVDWNGFEGDKEGRLHVKAEIPPFHSSIIRHNLTDGLRNGFNYCDNVFAYYSDGQPIRLERFNLIEKRLQDVPDFQTRISTFPDWVSEPTGYLKLDFNEIENYETEVLNEISSILYGTDHSEYINYADSTFLNGIIRKTKPKLVVEYGVSSGHSSAVILNAIKDIPNAKCCSVDYHKRDNYGQSAKDIGWLVHEKFSDLAHKWELYCGGVCCQYLDQITNNGKDKIDICFLDTVHSLPGELLNLLEVLPYMRENGIIIVHDIGLHTWEDKRSQIACHICLNTLNGKRIILWHDPQQGTHSKGINVVSNIGAVILDSNIENMHYPLFSGLSLPWTYQIKYNDYVRWLTHFRRFYPEKVVNIFENSYKLYNDL
jgi:predicted O-methyltransferase YrrM